MKKGLIAAISIILGTIIGYAANNKLNRKSIVKKDEKIDKFKAYYNILNEWLILKQNGKKIDKYFLDKGYKTIAIYGVGEMGNRLYDELKQSNIKIKYAIDKNAKSSYNELNVYDLSDTLETVDAIVVSAIFAFDEIAKEIAKVVDYPIISLSDIIYEI